MLKEAICITPSRISGGDLPDHKFSLALGVHYIAPRGARRGVSHLGAASSIASSRRFSSESGG